jgi:ATP synthase F1 epsilon subunit
MRPTFELVIATAEEVVFEGAAEELVLRVPSGDIAFLANHGRFVGEVEVGIARVSLADDTVEEVILDGGLVRVGNNQVVVLARGAEFVRDLDAAVIERRRRRLAELQGQVDDAFLEPVREGLALRETKLGV